MAVRGVRTLEEAKGVISQVEGSRGSRIAPLRAVYEHSAGAEKTAKRHLAATLAAWHVQQGVELVPGILAAEHNETMEAWQEVLLEAEHALFYQPKLPDALMLRGMALTRRTELAEGLAATAAATVFPARCFNHMDMYQLATANLSSLLQSVDVVAGHWDSLKQTGDVPPLRYYSAYCQTDDELYVFGGASDEEERYEKAKEMIDSLPEVAFRQMVGTIIPMELMENLRMSDEDDRHIAATLMAGEGGEASLNDLWALNLRTMTWRYIEARHPPRGREQAAIWVLGHRLYLYGGIKCGHDDNVYVLNLQKTSPTWKRLKISGPSPGGRQGHSVTVYNGRAYLWGGCTDDIGVYKFLPPDASSGGQGGGAVRGYRWEAIPTQAELPRLDEHMAWVDLKSHQMDIHGGNLRAREGVQGKCAETNVGWAFDLRREEWFFQEGAARKMLTMAPLAEAAFATHSKRWAYGGYWDGWDHILVHPSSSNPLAPQPTVMESFYYDHLHCHDGGGWRLVVAEGQGPGRRAGSVVAELPEGGGVVVWGGYTTLNRQETAFVGRPRLLPGLYKCTLKDDALFADLHAAATSSPSPAGISAAVAPAGVVTYANCAVQQVGPSLQQGELMQMELNTDAWKEACRRLVQQDITYRKRMSEIAWQGFREHGTGVLLATWRPTLESVVPVPSQAVDPGRMVYATRRQGPQHFRQGSQALATFHGLVDCMSGYDRRTGFGLVIMPGGDLSGVEELGLGMHEMFSHAHSFGYHGGFGDVPASVKSAGDCGNGAASGYDDTLVDRIMSARVYSEMCSLQGVTTVCAYCLKLEVLEEGGPDMQVTGKFQRCSQCRVAKYCSRQCQKAHWRVHKKDCARLREEGNGQPSWEAQTMCGAVFSVSE